MRSLVQAAREKREPRWRLLEAALERLAEVGIGPYAMPRSDFTPTQEREVRRLLEEGAPLKRIARETGIGFYRVQRVARRAYQEEQ